MLRTIDRLRLSFRPGDGGFTAGADAHDATVNGGQLIMVPHHFDGVQMVDGAPMRFSTTEILRGDAAVADAAGSTSLAEDGTVLIARGAVTEMVENQDDGVEQSWRFASAPQGDGDLVVAVAVSGQQEVKASKTGLHFLNPGQLGFAYAHATWVDASRRSWSVPVGWDGREIVMRVPSSVLDRSAYPAVLDPVISAERNVDAAVDGFPGGSASQPVLSRGSGGNYLAVWTDNRNGSQRESEIWAARLRANGAPLDPRGISIAHTSVEEHEASVTWTGSEWLLAWTREDAVNAAIGAATVAPDGTLTDLGIVAGTDGFESQPALASAGGGNALLTYTWNLQIRAMRYSGGSFGAFFTVASTADDEGFSAVAASGSNYLVTWQRGEVPSMSLMARIVNPSGANPTAFTISGPAGSITLPTAVFDGTNYLVAFARGGDIRGARVTTAGTVLDADGVVISSSVDAQTDPALACNSTTCLLTWAARDPSDPDDNTFDVAGQYIGFDLVPVGGEIAISSEPRNQTEPAVSTSGTSAFLVLWTDARSGVSNVFASRILANGTVESPNGLHVNTAIRNAQTRPAYAVGSTTELAVWADSRNFGDDIMSVRYDNAGNKLDALGQVVSDAQGDQTGTSVAFDGGQYVAVWRDSRNSTADVFAARVQEDGALSDPAGIDVATGSGAQFAPDVASDGNSTLVVWQHRATITDGLDIMGAIMAPNGSVSAPFPICQTGDDHVTPSVAWDPSSGLYVVAWADFRTDASPDIYAARVEPDGNVLDPCGTAITTRTNWQLNPDVAVSGNQLLVVWTDFQDDFFGDVYGDRITADATGITRLDGDGVGIATGVSYQTMPVTVGVGSGRWGIAWTDTINENTAGTDIVGTTMQSDGSFEPQYVISGAVYFEANAIFQSGGDGSSNVVQLLYEYNRPATGNLRVKKRTLIY